MEECWVHYLLSPAAQAAAHHVSLQLGPPAELHWLVVPGQSGLTLPVHHQHKLDHPFLPVSMKEALTAVVFIKSDMQNKITLNPFMFNI